ncbi:MAG: 4'-phosphopantetheinyl transferase superfamily protein [Bacteroidales bacterium]|nr:4'-phosphopantetheinyl transferase superfamily protein [Bacteroidales bacterium]
MVEVFGIRLPDDDPFQRSREQLFDLLPASNMSGILKYKNESSLRRTLLGEVLSRKLLGIKLNFSCKEIDVNKSGKGKPFIKNNNSIFFNISHSGDWIVCAISSKDVGIDVEKIKKPVYRIAERYFSKEERAALSRLDEPEKTVYFFDLWTLKESYLKMLGKGLTKSLGSFTISRENAHFKIIESGYELKKVFFMQYNFDKDYTVSVCSNGDQFAEHITILSLNELLDLNDGK